MEKKNALFSALLAISLCLGVASMPGYAETDIQKKIVQKQKQLKQIQQKEKSVLKNLLSTQKELEKISTNLNRLTSQVGATEKRIAMVQNELNQAEKELNEIQNEISGQREVLNQRLVAIYKYGYQSYLEILFRSQNFGEFITRFELIGNIVHKDLSMLKKLQHQMEKIAEKKKEIAEKQMELQREKKIYTKLQNQTKDQHSLWASRVKMQREQLASIQNDRKKLEEALDELERTSREMESQIRNLQHNSREKLGTGVMTWPLTIKGRISSYFGYRVHPILKKQKYHSGIDIAAPRGTPILAADDGIVIFSSTNGGYGKMVTIDHGAGISTVYAHCDVLLVSVHQKVTKGQRIALVGTTGLSTGPHLHFEVRKNGKPTDPLSYL
ncbi:MAG TPA: peptidoglycan DD-metalloendopeptidase family protein [Bacillota bacterium]|nr:peptidoglycan DD-metalloendopeptidase family protein [Bacillota bacterium]